MERNGLYSLLAAVFREELTEGLLRKLLAPDFLNTLAEAGIDTGELSALMLDDAFIEDLTLEFSRLFMGPGKHVPPYESVHLGGDGGTLWGPETSAVKKFIGKSGFTYDENYHGLPDHISVELEFMAHLTGLEAEAWQLHNSEKAINCLRFQKEFLNRHLNLWAGKFADKVAELAELPLYPKMAKLTRDFVEADHKELSKISDTN